jgi:hypothetical protein
VRGHKGKKTTDKELKIVAELYREAQIKRISVQQYVASEMDVSVSTAAKRIMASRKANFIPPADEYSKPGCQNSTCVFTLPNKEMDKLNHMANAIGVTRSSLVREAVHLYMSANSQG